MKPSNFTPLFYKEPLTKETLNTSPGFFLLLRKKPLYGSAFLFLLLLGVFSFLIPLISSYTYDQIDLNHINEAPSFLFWMGTDDLGRDIFTRVFYGTRISLSIGVFAACMDLLVGVLLGAFSGYSKAKWDEGIMRFCDILHAIPNILVALLLIVSLGKGILAVFLTICFSGWVNMTRAVRGQALTIKYKEFVLASIALGASKKRILFSHIIPNLWGTILATLTFTVPNAIFLEAFLSFLSLGISPPTPSLGGMIGEGIGTFSFFPWRVFFPSLIISLLMLSINLLGSYLRDFLDPKEAL